MCDGLWMLRRCNERIGGSKPDTLGKLFQGYDPVGIHIALVLLAQTDRMEHSCERYGDPASFFGVGGGMERGLYLVGAGMVHVGGFCGLHVDQTDQAGTGRGMDGSWLGSTVDLGLLVVRVRAPSRS